MIWCVLMSLLEKIAPTSVAYAMAVSRCVYGGGKLRDFLELPFLLFKEVYE